MQAQVTATLPGGTRAATVSVLPRSVTVAIGPSDVVGGSGTQGTVTLPAVAGPQGALVQLSSGNAAVASVPASVTVAPGGTSATFAVTTTTVAAATSVIISATYGATGTAMLTVGPLSMSSLALTPASVMGGTVAQGTVVLNGVAPAGGAIVTLSSDNRDLAAVPGTVTVAAGADRASFSITTSAVQASASAVLTATYGGRSGSGTLTITPWAPPPPNPNLLSSGEAIGASPWVTGGT